MPIPRSPLFEFDEATHRYTLGRVRLPSVTETINCIVPQWKAGEWYLARGRAFHAAVHLLASGRLNWATVAPEIESRVRAVAKLLKDNNWIIKASEVRLASKKHWFAGTLDASVGEPTGGLPIIVDWKSYLADAVIPQLGGYSLLYTENNHGKRLKIAVGIGIGDDGKPRYKWLIDSELRKAEAAFLHFHSTANWLRAHGYVKQAA